MVPAWALVLISVVTVVAQPLVVWMVLRYARDTSMTTAGKPLTLMEGELTGQLTDRQHARELEHKRALQVSEQIVERNRALAAAAHGD
ncbi:MAG: hypothetical protein ACRBI6_04715 [Acidimicrobiales bacterium]